jgi:sugar lactone lactonase YvrE
MNNLRILPVALLVSSLSLVGCSNMVTTAVTTPAVVGDMTGTVHGGQQPISGSTVTLWAAGNAGYGSAATQLATTMSDANGGFSFGPSSGHTYTCPSSVSTTTSEQLYIIATGGQPTPGVTNSSIALMAALGDCGSVQTLNPSLNINEVTTVASIYALQQFFTLSSTGLGNIGSSASNITGLRNAFFTVNNLVNLASGVSGSKTATAPVSGYSPAPVITVTPEFAKINSIANILAACVNSNGSGSTPCSTLYTKSASTPAVDTLQAAFNLAANPTSTVGGTSNIQAIYNTINSQAPFSPALGSAPNDWTLAVTYGSSSSQTIAASPVYFVNQPEWISVDSQGNIWFVNNVGATGNSVTEMSGIGVPASQVLTTPGTLIAPSGITLDPANDLFVSSYGVGGVGKQVTEYTNLSVVKNFLLNTSGPLAIVSDGAGNIYVASYGGADGSGEIEAIPVASATGTTAAPQATAISVGPNSSMAIDSNDTLWLSNYANTATEQFICSASPCGGTTTTIATAPQSVAIDHSGNIWIGNKGTSGSMAEISQTSTTLIGAVTGSPFTGGGLTNPFRSLVDGLGNIWSTNYAVNGGTLSELNNSGAPISPSTGFTHTFSGATGIAIDRSGNLWIGNNAATASSTTQGFLTEIIGQAAPVITPVSAGLPVASGGQNNLGIRP